MVESAPRSALSRLDHIGNAEMPGNWPGDEVYHEVRILESHRTDVTTMMHKMNHHSYWQDFPDTYRTEQVQQVARWVLTGESGLIVGCSGAGKSNLVGFIATRADILARFAKVDASQLTVLLYDINSLPLMSTSYFYHGLWHAIMQAADDLPPATATELQDISAQTGEWSDAFFALTTVNRTLDIVVNRGGRQVVLLLDRFDEACRRLDAQALNSLRSLRDRFKGRLIYVAATRKPLDRLRPSGEIDEFYELVAGRTCWAGPMVARDARWVAGQMAERLGVPFANADVNRLIDITGGLPAFLKAGCIALAEGHLDGKTNAEHWTEVLAAKPEIQRNCQELWNDLDASERQVVQSAADGGATHAEADNGVLAHTGLLIQDNGLLCPFSPIFTNYLLANRPQPAPDLTVTGLHLDPKTGVVCRDSVTLDVELTKNEHRLLHYFLGRVNDICTKDEIMAAVWPDDMVIDGVRDDRLAQLIKRLRDKIEPDPRVPVYIQTVRGRGYRFVQPSAQR